MSDHPQPQPHMPSKAITKAVSYTVTAALFYAVVSWMTFGPHNIGDLASQFFCPSGDPYFYAWFFNWWPFALSHHINPFYITYDWYPPGLNAAWLTSMPSVSLLFSPLTVSFGAQTTFNVVALLSPALAATSFFCLAFYLTNKFFPSLLSGYTFGFSSYMLGQLLGHTQLYFVAPLPCAILLFILRVNNRIGRKTFIGSFSIVALFEFASSLEIFSTFSIMSLLSLIIFYAAGDRTLRTNLLNAVKDVAWSFVPFVLLGSPYLYYLLVGLHSLPHQMAAATYFSTDILNFFLPTPVTRLGRTIFSSISAHFTGNYSEEGAYLGVPLILILSHYVITLWNDKYTKPLSAILLAALIFSLGSYLHVNGVITHVPLPWILISKLPLMNSALPLRLALYTSLVSAVMLAMWLSKSQSVSRSVVKYAAAIVACAFIWPNQELYHWTRPYIPKLFERSNVSKYLARNDNVLIISPNSGTYYQLQSGMRFRLYHNYLGFNPAAFHARFNPYSVQQNYAIRLEKYCGVHSIDRIVTVRTTSPQIISTLRRLSWRHITVGRSQIFYVPRALGWVDLKGDYFGLYPFSKSFHWMSHKLTITSIRKTANVEISGKYIPANIVEHITVYMDGKKVSYGVKQSTNLRLHLLRNGVITIKALDTFVPHCVIPNSNDMRHLSVLVRIKAGT